MKTINFKAIYPHLIAVAVFLIVAVIYCKPALEGKVLQQSDVTQWKGMAQDALEYREKNGITPLWTNSMFGGMPTYQITGIPVSAYSIGALDALFTLKLTEPVGLFFLASICFYFLAQVLGFSTLVGIIGGLAYSYATYNPIIVTVGHMTKMHAIGYLPLFIGSVLLIFKRKYLIGALMTAIATALFVQANHLQINYYGMIIVLFMSLYYLVIWLKEKDYAHVLKTIGFGLASGLIGLAVNAVMLVSTAEYGKASIRGGSALATKEGKASSTGLSADYAMSYSMYLSESLVLMFPNIYGGSSDPNTVDLEKTKAVEALQQMPQEVAQQLQSFMQFYWGGIGFTAGPPYIGILICFFAFIGLGMKANPNRWWILATLVFSILLAAGSYFLAFNTFMLEYLPLYNKFRAPSMIMVIPTLLVGIMALYGMEAMTNENSLKEIFKKYRTGFIGLGVVLGLVLFLYMSSDFKTEGDKQLMSQVMQIPDQNQRAAFLEPVRSFTDALAADRKGMIMSDLTRGFIFMGLALLLIFLVAKKSISKTIFLSAIGLLTLIDLFQVNTKYLKHDQFIEADENQNVFSLTELDMALKKDTSSYRVLDLRGGVQKAFNEGALIAYHHKSVGGYNPAKLSIYQDLIENQWYKFPDCRPTANMMNTKYIITGNMATDTVPNQEALGNAWFVKGIEVKKGPVEVMSALSFFNPKDTAIVEEKDKTSELDGIAFDSTASIQLVANRNDEISYSTTTNTKQLAVFSEVYYPFGWKAFIDNKEVPIMKVNYVLRALAIPPGKHAIRFELKPASIATAKLVSNTASILLWTLLFAIGFMEFRKQKKNA